MPSSFFYSANYGERATQRREISGTKIFPSITYYNTYSKTFLKFRTSKFYTLNPTLLLKIRKENI